MTLASSLVPFCSSRLASPSHPFSKHVNFNFLCLLYRSWSSASCWSVQSQRHCPVCASASSSPSFEGGFIIDFFGRRISMILNAVRFVVLSPDTDLRGGVYSRGRGARRGPVIRVGSIYSDFLNSIAFFFSVALLWDSQCRCLPLQSVCTLQVRPLSHSHTHSHTHTHTHRNRTQCQAWSLGVAQ
jgi:hypothetical protein